jgi:hypothetical protein
MLTMLDMLGLISAVLPWMQRVQVRRLERIGERVPFADESRDAIGRANGIAHAEGAPAVDPVHIARAIFELRTHPSSATDVSGIQKVSSDSNSSVASQLPFTYPAIVVLAEAVRVAADTHRPAAMPDHLLLGILRKRPGQATRFLASRGVTLASFAGPESTLAPNHE